MGTKQWLYLALLLSLYLLVYYILFRSFNEMTPCFLTYRCSNCGNESEASSKIEDFYELELNVKGLKSLDESLDDLLSIEELEGDNQYLCEACVTRVNATRSIKLRSLPAVLNFQLKRCVFLPNVIDLTLKNIWFCLYVSQVL